MSDGRNSTRGLATSQSVCICIATFRRPDGLRALLRSIDESVAAARAARPRILVVDNDVSATACDVATEFKVEYWHEPIPGIVAARNAALDKLSPADRWLIFVDDDERVDLAWYDRMLESRLLGAGVISGPVIPVYRDDTPKWIVKGDFFGRPNYRTGENNPFPATNNTLVDRRALDSLTSPRFDAKFSESGGSDSELFERIRATGVAIVWRRDAIVYEDVPPNRANLRWLWRRNMRLGNVSRRVRFGESPQLVTLALGLGRTLWGASLCTIDLIRLSPRRESFGHLAKGVGIMQASLGRGVAEYRRV